MDLKLRGPNYAKLGKVQSEQEFEEKWVHWNDKRKCVESRVRLRKMQSSGLVENSHITPIPYRHGCEMWSLCENWLLFRRNAFTGTVLRIAVENVRGHLRLQSASIGCIRLQRLLTSTACAVTDEFRFLWAHRVVSVTNQYLSSALPARSMSLNTFRRKLKTHLFEQQLDDETSSGATMAIFWQFCAVYKYSCAN